MATALTEEMKEKNYAIFKKKMNECGVDETVLDKVLGDSIKNATFSMTSDNGAAYDGALLNVILRTLTPYALKINEILPSNMQVDKTKLIKVCLIHQISKCEMFEKQTSEWHINKGILYKYAENKVSLKMGMRSLIIGEKLGLKFDEEDMEAITILDRDPSDEQARFHASTLAQILKQAAELTYLTLRNS